MLPEESWPLVVTFMDWAEPETVTAVTRLNRVWRRISRQEIERQYEEETVRLTLLDRALALAAYRRELIRRGRVWSPFHQRLHPPPREPLPQRILTELGQTGARRLRERIQAPASRRFGET